MTAEALRREAESLPGATACELSPRSKRLRSELLTRYDKARKLAPVTAENIAISQAYAYFQGRYSTHRLRVALREALADRAFWTGLEIEPKETT
jgi:hypothetical protein